MEAGHPSWQGWPSLLQFHFPVTSFINCVSAYESLNTLQEILLLSNLNIAQGAVEFPFGKCNQEGWPKMDYLEELLDSESWLLA